MYLSWQPKEWTITLVTTCCLALAAQVDWNGHGGLAGAAVLFLLRALLLRAHGMREPRVRDVGVSASVQV